MATLELYPNENCINWLTITSRVFTRRKENIQFCFEYISDDNIQYKSFLIYLKLRRIIILQLEFKIKSG